MKKILSGAALLCLTFTIPAPVFAADVCEVVTCMYGKMTGGDGGEVSPHPESPWQSADRRHGDAHVRGEKGRDV